MLDALVSWEALAAYAISSLIAIAFFVPFFRRYAIGAIGIIGGLLYIFRKGKREGDRNAREEWRRAEQRAIERGDQARRDAERRVDSGGVRDPRDRDDN